MDDCTLAEQQDEVTALESIFLEDFTILSGKDEPISFNLAVKILLPQDTINCNAWISVEQEISTDLAVTENSMCDANVQNEAGEILPQVKREGIDDGVDDETLGAVGGAMQVDDAHEDETQMLGAIGGIKTSSKFVIKRSVSRCHWHLSTELRYLTPINLRCAFHPQYPVEEPPVCQISCLWLNNQQLTTLQRQLYSLWQECPNQPIVFTWVDWLQYHALEYLGLTTHITLREAHDDVSGSCVRKEQSGSQLLPDPQGLVPVEMALYNILQYDVEKQKEAFMKGIHTCDVCFETKDGTDFTFLTDCQHSFCTECLRFHCEMKIQDGTVLRLYCPDQECKTVIPHTVLQEILRPDVFERWEKLVLSKTLDTMGDIVYCPRCNTCVVADDIEASKLAQCVQCYYTFCVDCLEQWHQDKPCGVGDEAYERRKPNDDLVNGKKKKRKKQNKNEYEGKNFNLVDMEKKHTKKEKHENMSSANFIRLMKAKGQYQRCPKCRFYVEKLSGCDFMHCSQCGSGFCWACGKAISSYNHFGNCHQEVNRRIPERQPTEGDLILEQFRRNNPGLKREEFVNCPRCRQRNLKVSTNNHLKCWACKTNFCCQCRKVIAGLITNHFLPSMPCSQHSGREPSQE